MHNTEALPELISTSDVATMLGRDVATVNRLAATGELRTAAKAPGVRGARLFLRADVEALVAKRTEKAGAA